jgi:membrane dipeptidase
MLGRLLNPTRQQPPYTVSDEALQLHSQLTVVDLHGDSLLWNKDVAARGGGGHIDLERLVKGNVAIQVFGMVTQFPLRILLEALPFLNADVIGLLSFFDGWPLAARRDFYQRAAYHARKFSALVEKASGQIKPVRTRKELDDFLTLRRDQPNLIGAMLGLEGAQALKGSLDNVQKLFDSSVRLLGLAHFDDNEAAGSANGRGKTGLTPFGREMLRQAQALHLIIDLAHSSPRTIDEACDLAEAPVIVSHTGVRAICENVRNLDDGQIKKVAASGGVIGIGLFKLAVCGDTIGDTVRSMRHVADLVGVEHVSLGSDFDGAVTAPIDASGLPLLTQGLLEAGFHRDEVAQIMGGNAIRMFRDLLPAG